MVIQKAIFEISFLIIHKNYKSTKTRKNIRGGQLESGRLQDLYLNQVIRLQDLYLNQVIKLQDVYLIMFEKCSGIPLNIYAASLLIALKYIQKYRNFQTMP